MGKKLKWLALFSQTGGEIYEVSYMLGRQPDKILTDNTDTSKFDKRLDTSNICIDDIRSYSKADRDLYYRTHLTGYDLITLHGWLNIVPAKVCEDFTIYNGHPGLITDYPELVGRDPQVRTWENIKNYKHVGSVVHEVTSVVDGGRVVCKTRTTSDNIKSLDKLFDVLKGTSRTSWWLFLRDKLQ